MALLASWALVSCSSADETPTPDVPSDALVSVDVALQIQASSKGGTTRTTADVTQNNNNFRGVDRVRLIPFKADQTVLTPFDVSGSAFFTYNNAENDVHSRHYLYKVIDLYKGTASFLCYGWANTMVSGGTDFQNGKTNVSYGTDLPESIEFSPQPISSDDAANQQRIAAYLTSIATVDGWAESDILRSIYDEFINNRGSMPEAFAGSGTNIIKQVNKLYAKFRDEIAPGEIRTAVLTAISNDDYVSFDETNGLVTGFKTADGEAMGDCPASLPDGSAIILWNNDPDVMAFQYQPSPNSYVYPVELCYYANSSIKTSKTSKRESYADNKSWSDILSAYDGADVVEEGTRSAAITDPLQYGVGCLQTAIRVTTQTYNGKTGLMDFSNNPDALIPVQDAEGNPLLPLKAIMIGGQGKLDYTLSPRYPDESAEGYVPADDPEYIIYDKSIADDGLSLGNCSFSKPVYTLAFQTKIDKSVKMVLEFENDTDREIVCSTGIIYPGTKFYLVASIVSPVAVEDYQKRIFTKDYMTRAELTISSLAMAYNALPDLNSDKIRLFTEVEAGIKEWVWDQEDRHTVYNW